MLLRFCIVFLSLFIIKCNNITSDNVSIDISHQQHYLIDLEREPEIHENIIHDMEVFNSSIIEDNFELFYKHLHKGSIALHKEQYPSENFDKERIKKEVYEEGFRELILIAKNKKMKIEMGAKSILRVVSESDKYAAIIEYYIKVGSYTHDGYMVATSIDGKQWEFMQYADGIRDVLALEFSKGATKELLLGI